MVGRNMTEEQRRRKREKDRERQRERRRNSGTRTVTRSERNSSEEQRYGGQVQLSSLFLLSFETKRKEKRDHRKKKAAHLLMEERI